MVRKAKKADVEVVAKLAMNVWKGASFEELVVEFENFVRQRNAVVLVKEADGKIVGFAQCGLRQDYVEGTCTSPVGYFEGVFIDEDYRKRGFAKELLNACENWAREKGCKEFASDCEFANKNSINFHLHSGFNEANKLVCFKKKL